jgi:hypothetical protein
VHERPERVGSGRVLAVVGELEPRDEHEIVFLARPDSLRANRGGVRRPGPPVERGGQRVVDPDAVVGDAGTSKPFAPYSSTSSESGR